MVYLARASTLYIFYIAEWIRKFILKGLYAVVISLAMISQSSLKMEEMILKVFSCSRTTFWKSKTKQKRGVGHTNFFCKINTSNWAGIKNHLIGNRLHMQYHELSPQSPDSVGFLAIANGMAVVESFFGVWFPPVGTGLTEFTFTMWDGYVCV